MPFMIYNLPGAIYNQRCQNIIERAREKYSNLDPISIEFQLVSIRKRLLRKRPATYDSFNLREDLAIWLSLEAPKFFFKETHLFGNEKALIVRKIKDLVLKHLYRDPELAEILIELYQFLERYAIVFAQ